MSLYFVILIYYFLIFQPAGKPGGKPGARSQHTWPGQPACQLWGGQGPTASQECTTQKSGVGMVRMSFSPESVIPNPKKA